MKYIVFNEGTFTNFDNWSDAEYFMLDKPNARCKKITSKKAEAEFIENCKNIKEYKQKIYIVVRKDQIKRFEKWKEAKEFIDLNPGSKYKSFESEEEAQKFLNLNVHNKNVNDSYVCKIESPINATIYKEKQEIDKIKIEPLSNSIESELNLVIGAIKKAISAKEEHILIEYKNMGVEMWANGTWNANKEYSQQYKKQIELLRKEINIDFKSAN